MVDATTQLQVLVGRIMIENIVQAATIAALRAKVAELEKRADAP